MRHPSTIGLVILPLNADLKVQTDQVRPRIRNALQELTHGSQTEGSFQVSLHAAEYLSRIIPECEWPDGFDPMMRPYEVFALLHWHGVICDPYLSKAAIRKQIDQAFPGCRRVCIRRVMPEKTDKSGRITHGSQGFHEYSLMNKTEIKFTDTKQKIDAVIGHAQLAATWTKRNRRFSMGQSLSVTGVEIDPERVGQLELMEKLHDVRKNWSKLDYAQQFIHLWMSGAIRLVRKPQDWLRLHGTIASRIKQIMQLVNNWCEEDHAQGIEFIDYVVASRE